jgi:hypothetical protein
MLAASRTEGDGVAIPQFALNRHDPYHQLVDADMGDPEGEVIVDESSFPKKGDHTIEGGAAVWWEPWESRWLSGARRPRISDQASVSGGDVAGASRRGGAAV